MTPLCVRATGGYFVVMATSQTSAPMGLVRELPQTSHRVHSGSTFHHSLMSISKVCMYVQACALVLTMCQLSLAGGEYICYHCGRYSDRVCACSMLFAVFNPAESFEDLIFLPSVIAVLQMVA